MSASRRGSCWGTRPGTIISLALLSCSVRACSCSRVTKWVNSFVSFFSHKKIFKKNNMIWGAGGAADLLSFFEEKLWIVSLREFLQLHKEVPQMQLEGAQIFQIKESSNEGANLLPGYHTHRHTNIRVQCIMAYRCTKERVYVCMCGWLAQK